VDDDPETSIVDHDLVMEPAEKHEIVEIGLAPL
jgi:hypothetical protein